MFWLKARRQASKKKQQQQQPTKKKSNFGHSSPLSLLVGLKFFLLFISRLDAEGRRVLRFVSLFNTGSVLHFRGHFCYICSHGPRPQIPHPNRAPSHKIPLFVRLTGLVASPLRRCAHDLVSTHTHGTQNVVGWGEARGGVHTRVLPTYKCRGLRPGPTGCKTLPRFPRNAGSTHPLSLPSLLLSSSARVVYR